MEQNHHAYVTFAKSLAESLVPENYKKTSTDVYHVVTPRLSIDDARSLTELSKQRPFEAEKRVFVIVTSDIAIEAQNALLKLFEEPPAHAQFYVVVPKTAFLLPTLRSRLASLFSGTQSLSDKVSEDFDTFARASYADRLAIVGEKTKIKDLVWIEEIVSGSELFTQTQVLQKEQLLRAVLLVRSYISNKGASSKMLLEELALVLPLVK